MYRVQGLGCSREYGIDDYYRDYIGTRFHELLLRTSKFLRSGCTMELGSSEMKGFRDCRVQDFMASGVGLHGFWRFCAFIV